MIDEKKLREEIFKNVRKIYELRKSKERFEAGKSPVLYSGRVFDEKEIISLVDSSLDFWLTAGRFAAQFESNFANYLSRKYCMLTNSGSSANLLAMSALTSPKLEERRLKPGDEVITTAAGFPTTVNPIFQNNLIPVFVDVDIGTYNPDPKHVEEAVSEKTKAIFFAHTLGNPFDLKAITKIAEKHGLFLIEDSCDALGSTFDRKLVGTFGNIATYSFYPAHHITMGEGGAVVTDDPVLKTVIESFRDWGRDCWCSPGKSNTCEKRFAWKLGDMPYGYDHKYIFSHIGYNLKITDMQAAIGVEQLKKLPEFIAARKRNFKILYEALKDYEDLIILPKKLPDAEPSWFGFLVSIRPDSGFERSEIVNFLEGRNIATRMLFTGNLTRQPAYKNHNFRVSGGLKNTDFIMTNTFWLGVYPGLTSEMIDYMIKTLKEFFQSKTNV
jgi:CDP-6-deoxy-D-xylo-4-hexulose-3-dehydrase